MSTVNDQTIDPVGTVDQEQLTAWKAKYGKVYQFIQEDDKGQQHVTYVCKPTFEQVQYAFTYIAEDLIKTGKILLDDCRLGGSEVALNEPEFKIGLCTKMVGYFKAKTVEIVKEA
jgi:hypothetical protein